MKILRSSAHTTHTNLAFRVCYHPSELYSHTPIRMLSLNVRGTSVQIRTLKSFKGVLSQPMSSKRGGYRGKKAVNNGGGDETAGDDLPSFSALMRSVYKRTHPDLLRARFPEAATNNAEALQVINGILTTIKRFNQFPPQIISKIPLSMLTKGGDDVMPVVLNIKTAGGECRKSLTTSFADLFAQAGLLENDDSAGGKKKGKNKGKGKGDVFVWNEGYFPTEPTPEDEEDAIVV